MHSSQTHPEKSECAQLISQFSLILRSIGTHFSSPYLQKKINYDFAAHVTGKILVESYVVMVPDSYVEHF